MSTYIKSSELNHKTIKSGGRTTATVRYKSAQEGTIQITASAGYQVEPTEVPAPHAPAGGETSPELKVSGSAGKCTLTFKLFASSFESMLEVT